MLARPRGEKLPRWPQASVAAGTQVLLFAGIVVAARVIGEPHSGPDLLATLARAVLAAPAALALSLVIAHRHRFGTTWTRAAAAPVLATIGGALLTAGPLLRPGEDVVRLESLGVLALGLSLLWGAACVAPLLQKKEGARVEGEEGDPLTGLLNRRGATGWFDHLASGTPVVVLYLDLNDLHSVNEASGHDVGDAHLVAVARALSQSLPPGAIAARWGGDEFVILIPAADERDAQDLAERVGVTVPTARPGLPAFAVGTATAVAGESLERAIVVADGCMQRAKAAQRATLTRLTGERVPDLEEFASQLEMLDTPEDLIRTGLGTARELLGFDASMVFRRRDDHFLLTHAFGWLPDSVRAKVGVSIFERGEGVIGRTVIEGRTHWSADYAADPDALPEWVDYGLKSILVVPVRERERLVALVALANFRQWRAIAPQARRTTESVASRLSFILERRRAIKEVRRTLEGGLLAIGLALEGRDLETAGHTERVVNLAESLGRKMGLRRERLEALRQGAFLHDIGKLGVPDSVLLKRGRLDATEWELMQAHASIGFDLAIKIPTLSGGALEVIRHHHERFDGRGYPDGLAGERIPLRARIFAVCDVYDALVSERPYKGAWTHREAIAEIRSRAGTQFDPDVVHAFLELVDAGEVGPDGRDSEIVIEEVA
jgi:diguanylate cyclase (GGDEF)-like protein